MVYDYTVQSREDPMVNDTEKLLRFLTGAFEPGAYFVDALPFCKLFHLPYGGVRMLTPSSEVSAGLVPGRRLQKSRERVAHVDRRYVWNALQACTADRGLWVSDIPASTTEP